MLLAAIALAAETPRSIVAYGPSGTFTCATWNSLRGQTAGDQMDFWFLGFVTGYNFYSPKSGGDIGRELSATDLLAWVHHYCVGNPLDNNVQASQALLRELERRRK